MKLPKAGESTKHKKFRGNLLTASIDQIKNKRPGAIDDIYSLLCVAYQFVFDSIPWRDYMNIKHAQDNHANKRQAYLQIRKDYHKTFDEELC